MQPFLVFLLAELGVFYLAVLGDVYLTNFLVRTYGFEAEGNPVVRRLYQEGRLRVTWAAFAAMLLPYAFLAYLGLNLIEPYVPFAVALCGALLPLLAMANLAHGSVVFLKAKRALSSRPLSSAPN